jgi:hypothetical protein
VISRQRDGWRTILRDEGPNAVVSVRSGALKIETTDTFLAGACSVIETRTLVWNGERFVLAEGDVERDFEPGAGCKGFA